MAIFGPGEYFNVDIDADRRPQHIHGIVCDVTSCAYHDGDSFCTARRVHVGPLYANTTGQTLCATFKPREMGASTHSEA